MENYEDSRRLKRKNKVIGAILKEKSPKKLKQAKNKASDNS